MNDGKERFGFCLGKSQKAHMSSGVHAQRVRDKMPSIRQTSEKDITDLFLEEAGMHTQLTRQQEYDLMREMGIIRNFLTVLNVRIDDASISDELKKDIRSQHSSLQSQLDNLRDRFINANLRLVVYIARSFFDNRMPLCDLIQEGNLGLIHAVDKFDYRRGVKFSSYASWWILRHIFKAITENSYAYKVPKDTMDQLQKVSQKTGKDLRSLTRGDIQDEFPGSFKGSGQNEKSIYAIPVSISLDTDPSCYKYISSSEDSTEEKVMALHDIRLVQECLHKLPARLKTIIELSWGIGGAEKMTFREMAVHLLVTTGKKISPQRVSQLEQDAKEKLRSIVKERIREPVRR
ncbi:MAG: sigma-70 family RNA polymerase sigma factor [bacterium]|nr:sigma-70 family RNA polymerase sigma factor [bacterium]